MNEQAPIRILLVDDHPLMRRGMRDLLAMEDDLQPVGEAGTGEEALRLVDELDPDLILLDLNMPGMDGLETLQRLREVKVDARIILFTVSDDQSHVLEALRQPEKFKDNPEEKARLEALTRDPPPDHVARAAYFAGQLRYEAGKFADALTRFASFPQQYAGSTLLPAAYCSKIQTTQRACCGLTRYWLPPSIRSMS